MTKQDFIQYLSHPENLNGHSIDSLEKLVQEYPYFQIGRMLYLKNLHNQESINYEKNLHITSAYAPVGKVLYNLIKKKTEIKPEARSEKSEVELPVIGNQLSVIREEIKTEKEIFPKLEPVAVLQEVLMTAKVEKDSLPAIGITTAEKKNEADELHLLEKEMLREAMRTSMTIDLLEEKDLSTSPSVTTKEKTDYRKPITDNEYSFNDWLKVIGGKTPDSSIEEKAVQKIQKSELIDRFILDETIKSKPKTKTEFYSADSMAKKSLQDNETFVSETLARIYLKQGNLPKALRAYEILLVKYPEKIHIFAPLLEKIKKLLEDQKGR